MTLRKRLARSAWTKLHAVVLREENPVSIELCLLLILTLVKISCCKNAEEAATSLWPGCCGSRVPKRHGTGSPQQSNSSRSVEATF